MKKIWFYENMSPTVVQGYHVVPIYEEKTNYQQLAVYQHDLFGRMLVLDNLVQTNEYDEWIYHEMMTHVPIMAMQRPAESVLIIGGGDGGILRQALRHQSIQRVTMVELDQAVVEASKKYLNFSKDFSDPRLKLIYADGASYVQSPEAREAGYDVIIVDSPDPVGPAKVLFEKKFYSGVRECLKEDGVMVRQAGVPMYQGEELTEAVERIKSVFGNAAVYHAPIPVYGGDMAFVISTKDGSSCEVPREEFFGNYYNSKIHAAAFALPTFWNELVCREENTASPLYGEETDK